MPERATVERARKARRAGKAPSTQAGEFVREEIHHVREGRHGVRSTKQAIAIGLSKARRSGVRLPEGAEAREGRYDAERRRPACRLAAGALAAGQGGRAPSVRIEPPRRCPQGRANASPPRRGLIGRPVTVKAQPTAASR